MKIIKDNVTGMFTLDDNPYWPLINVRDNYPENMYQSPVNNTEIQMQLGAPTLYANELFVGYTNATTASLVVVDLSYTPLITEPNLTISTFDYFNYVTDTTPVSYSQLWYSYTNPAQEHKIVLTLGTTRVSSFTVSAGGTGYSAGTFVMTKAGAINCTGKYNVDVSGAVIELLIEDPGEAYTSDAVTGEITGHTLVFSNPGTGAVAEPYSHLQVGIIRAGFSQRYRNPALGLTETSKDLGTYLKRPDGTEYIVPGRILRTFAGTLNLKKEDSALVYAALIGLRRVPAAINLLDTDSAYVCFGKTSALPAMKRNTITRKQLTFALQEM